MVTAGSGPALWIERDDQTGLALGGNRTRKLEHPVGGALAAGADVLVTGGVPAPWAYAEDPGGPVSRADPGARRTPARWGVVQRGLPS